MYTPQQAQAALNELRKQIEQTTGVAEYAAANGVTPSYVYGRINFLSERAQQDIEIVKHFATGKKKGQVRPSWRANNWLRNIEDA